MWIIVLFISVIFTKATGQPYYFSNESFSSTNAPQICTLATPPITYSEVEERVDLKNSVPITESVWVGYVMNYATFLYKGCASGDSLINPNVTRDIRADLGQCYSICRTRFIGIKMRRPLFGSNEKCEVLKQKSKLTSTRVDRKKEATCYCLESLPVELNENHCTVECTKPQDTLCGNGNINFYFAYNNYVSVYEKVTEPQTSLTTYPDDISGRCLAFNQSGRSLFWGDCSTAYRRMCQNGNDGEIYKYDDRGPWQTVTRKCLGEKLYPVDPRTNLKSVQEQRDLLWMGAVRSLCIFPISDIVANEKRYLQGYINNKLQLQFSRQTDAFQLRSLCIASSSISTLGTQMTTQYTLPPQTTSVKTSAMNPTTTETSPATIRDNTTQPSSPSSNDVNKAAQSKDSHGGIVAVYVAVPLVLFAIAVVIGLVIWRRRIKRPEKHLRSLSDSSGLSQKCTSPSKGTTPEKADVTLNHDYLILEPVNEYAAIKVTDMDQNGDEEYDTTESARGNINDTNTGNIYNRFEDVSEDMYNHTNTLNTRDNDTYNHTGNCANETTYTTAKTRSRSKTGAGPVNTESRQANDDDDTYNHIHIDSAV